MHDIRQTKQDTLTNSPRRNDSLRNKENLVKFLHRGKLSSVTISQFIRILLCDCLSNQNSQVVLKKPTESTTSFPGFISPPQMKDPGNEVAQSTGEPETVFLGAIFEFDWMLSMKGCEYLESGQAFVLHALSHKRSKQMR